MPCGPVALSDDMTRSSKPGTRALLQHHGEESSFLCRYESLVVKDAPMIGLVLNLTCSVQQFEEYKTKAFPPMDAVASAR